MFEKKKKKNLRKVLTLSFSFLLFFFNKNGYVSESTDRFRHVFNLTPMKPLLAVPRGDLHRLA